MAVVLVITGLEGTAQTRVLRLRPVVWSVSAVTVDTTSASSGFGLVDQSVADIRREPLESLRAGERVYLFREPPNPDTPMSARALLFSATTLLSAHLPRPLRLWLQDGLEVEPLFVRGGMGLTVGGHWF